MVFEHHRARIKGRLISHFSVSVGGYNSPSLSGRDEGSRRIAKGRGKPVGYARACFSLRNHLGFERQAQLPRKQLQLDLVSRILSETIRVGDAAESSSIWIVVRRAIDRLVLISDEATPLQKIIVLCRRFPLFVERLQNRQRGRPSYKVDDEYDVQDLLHAILKLHFDDVRPEEHTPSFGGNASRVDFYFSLPEPILVEAKMTRSGLGQKEVTDQLINDVARYSKVDGIDLLVCLVFDPERRCKNPDSVENDVQSTGSRLTVRAIVCPKGL